MLVCFISPCYSLKKKSDRSIKNGLSVTCSLCEAQVCRSCSKLDKARFDAISTNHGTSWFCELCQTLPGVKKLLVRIGNIEARQDELEDRVQKIEKDIVTSDNVKNLSEVKEVESRKLNVMCFNIPESKRSDFKDRQNEDKDFLVNLMDTKLNYSLGD